MPCKSDSLFCNNYCGCGYDRGCGSLQYPVPHACLTCERQATFTVCVLSAVCSLCTQVIIICTMAGIFWHAFSFLPFACYQPGGSAAYKLSSLTCHVMSLLLAGSLLAASRAAKLARPSASPQATVSHVHHHTHSNFCSVSFSAAKPLCMACFQKCVADQLLPATGERPPPNL